MNKVHFKSEKIDEKTFVVELRKNVSNYFKTQHISTKANAAMVIKTVVMVLIYILPFVAILTIPMPAVIALCLCVVMGIGIAGVGMSVMHDACHGAYSKKHWINDVLGGSLYLLGSNVLNWKIQHNVLHHTYTNIAGLDEDIAAKGPIRLAMETPVKKHHRFQFIFAFIFYGMMTIAKLINDFSNLLKYDKKGLVREQHGNLRSEFIKMAIRKLLYVTVIFGLPLWLTDFKWYQVLTGFVVMHWVASMILSFVFQLAHVVEGAEQPFEEDENYSNWHVHQLRTTSDFARNNKLLGWYIGGLNFQIEHHLFPNICHIHYNKIAPIVQKTALQFGFPYNLKPSFTSAFASHIKMLKQLGAS